MTDSNGQTMTSAVRHVVAQAAHSLRHTPHAKTLAVGSRTQVAAVVLDQFGHPIAETIAATYKLVEGSGSITSAGLYIAGQKKGHVVVRVTINDLTGTIA